MSCSLASVLHGTDLRQCGAGEAEHADADRVTDGGVSLRLGRGRVGARTEEEPRRGHPALRSVGW